jgi:hypothetical protein
LVAARVDLRRLIGDLGELLLKFLAALDSSHPRVRHRYVPPVSSSRIGTCDLAKRCSILRLLSGSRR